MCVCVWKYYPRSPVPVALYLYCSQEQGLVDILARWDRAIAKFANEFSEAEAVVDQ